MAKNTNTKTQPATNAPSFIAWSIITKGENKAFWQKVGACWSHKDAQGLTLQLDVMPLDGRIVLRKPLPPEQAAS